MPDCSAYRLFQMPDLRPLTKISSRSRWRLHSSEADQPARATRLVMETKQNKRHYKRTTTIFGGHNTLSRQKNGVMANNIQQCCTSVPIKNSAYRNYQGVFVTQVVLQLNLQLTVERRSNASKRCTKPIAMGAPPHLDRRQGSSYYDYIDCIDYHLGFQK